MLIEIESELFKENGKPRGKIVFHKGLNTVVATETTNNSTGKSSFLLAIDFAFGGTAYTEEDAKIIENVGHHVVNFAFDFDGEKLYFSRSTATTNSVNICNSLYETEKTITLEEFRTLLAQKNNFEDKTLSFRGAVSPYFRISHKSSKNLAEFLKGSIKQIPRNSVINFEKLFNRFKDVEAEKKNADDAKKADDTFKDAIKRNFIPSGIKSDKGLKGIQEEAEALKQKLFDMSKTNDENVIALDAKNAEKLKALSQRYRNAASRKTKLENKINIAQDSLEGISSPTSEELTVLQSYFPSVNLKKLYALEQFHESLSSVLKVQINDEINYLKMQLNEAILNFESAKNEYENALPKGGLSKASFDDYGKTYFELQKLYERIENYHKGKLISATETQAKAELNSKEIDVLISISEQVNQNMADLNKLIQKGKWKNPILKFTPPKTDKANGISSYSILSGTDAGDGTASANIMMFDLTVLHFTKLPAIVHDLFVRSELDEERKEDCIKLYTMETEKQIFTAFRSISNYSPEIQKIIEDNAVLHLYTNGGELYGTSKWVKNSEESE